MTELRFTLVSDGAFDEALVPLLTWMLRAQGVSIAISPSWADFRSLPDPPRELARRVEMALYLYPCELLFIHRDAENQAPEGRRREIQNALSSLSRPDVELPLVIFVVPVRMTEAWLLFNEAAIRRAAGNPKGAVPLALPRTQELEKLPDPKKLLHELLRQASELGGRRLKAFPTPKHARRVAELLDDFSPLRVLSAFADLERDVSRMIHEQGWNRPDQRGPG